MKPTIRELLAGRGVEISEKDAEELTRQWAGVEELRRGYEGTFAGESDIAVKYVPGVITLDRATGHHDS